jgi:hypothetical protein
MLGQFNLYGAFLRKLIDPIWTRSWAHPCQSLHYSALGVALFERGASVLVEVKGWQAILTAQR